MNVWTQYKRSAANVERNETESGQELGIIGTRWCIGKMAHAVTGTSRLKLLSDTMPAPGIFMRGFAK